VARLPKKRASIQEEDEFEIFKKQVTALITRWFPQHELLIRTDGKISHLKISKTMQISALAVFAISVGWGIFASFSYFIHDELVISRNKEILEARMAYRGLLSEVQEYQDKFSDLTDELSKNHGLMLNLVEKNATLKQNMKSAVNKLETSKSRHKRILIAKANLKEKLANIQIELNSLNNHNFSLKGNLNSVTTDLESALFERNLARSKSQKLSETVKKLMNDLAELNKSEIKVLRKLTETTKNNIADIHYVLEHTGLNVAKLLGLKKMEKNKRSAQGGPFIPFSLSNNPSANLKSSLHILNSQLKQYRNLQGLMKRLPLSSPLNYFTVSSHFGKRRDPINKRWAVHQGLDFGGIKNSPVYSTAPGKVSFAGRNGKYGKLIEIIHGYGFKTKYGHLNKILVKRGQKVDYRAKIGLMGSTGRSTGPHLHYEILMRGKHQNPWRFIKAGRYVYKR